MSAIKDLRDTLVADLAPLGVSVHADWPIRAEPPCVFLAPPLGGNYVTGGREFATYILSIDAVVLVARRPPDEGREDLETLVEALLRNTVDWALIGVESPSTVNMAESSTEFLGTVVHLSKPFTLH